MTVPVNDNDVSSEAIELVRVHAAEAPAYDLLAAYGIYSPSLVQISL